MKSDCCFLHDSVFLHIENEPILDANALRCCPPLIGCLVSTSQPHGMLLQPFVPSFWLVSDAGSKSFDGRVHYVMRVYWLLCPPLYLACLCKQLHSVMHTTPILSRGQLTGCSTSISVIILCMSSNTKHITFRRQHLWQQIGIK